MDRPELTRLLGAWSRGDEGAAEQALPLVYDTLRRLADHYMARESFARTLQPTALVHEAYLRLVGQPQPDWESRRHFYGVAARVMRQILVDNARARLSAKRGGGALRVELTEAAELPLRNPGVEIIALSDALDALALLDTRKAQIIELRYFGGMTESETAQSVGISVATVRREARLAEAFLCAQMNP